ncbi:MAG: class E sortase, partial [Actinobacteria bacterium]|nr:class E sortase [Actinomycetota bacterium]
MKTPKLWTILRWVAALGIITAGVILVVRGESSTSDQTARFTEEQQALRRAFGVFPDGSQSGDQGSANATARESIALLAIPSIDVDVVVVNYFGYSDLETAVARMQNSAQIGTEGSAVIVGHRTGFGSPFRNLDDVKVGDEVDVTLRTGEKLSFSVTRSDIVSPSVDLSTFDNKSDNPQ